MVSLLSGSDTAKGAQLALVEIVLQTTAEKPVLIQNNQVENRT